MSGEEDKKQKKQRSRTKRKERRRRKIKTEEEGNSPITASIPFNLKKNEIEEEERSKWKKRGICQ